jgi:hypothetical protein
MRMMASLCVCFTTFFTVCILVTSLGLNLMSGACMAVVIQNSGNENVRKIG